MENDRAKFKKDFKARIYRWTLSLVKFTANLPKNLTTDVMGKQLMRSGTSVIANYIEANSASSKKDFTNFFTHALKSANESKVWLSLIKDTSADSKVINSIPALLAELNEISKILASSIMKLKGKK
ncbi:MAG: four helix bundle protein [Patescibacteria group bacterium]